MKETVNCLECGKELNKKQKMFCSNNCKLKNKDAISIRTKPKEKLDPSKAALCKVTGKIYKDYKNYSGALTRHIREHNISIEDVLDNFLIIDNPEYNKPVYSCKYCDWKSIDVKNKSGCITNHILEHSVQIEDHIISYPEEHILFYYNRKSVEREKLFSTNSKAYVICLECNQKMKKITNIHLRKHNMSPNDYRIKYNKEILSSDETIEKYKIIYELNKDKINITNNTSKAENEIADFISSIDPNILKSTKKIIPPYEIDIFSEKHNIAIEYNGLAYHSENFGKKDRLYHVTKTDYCEEKKIRLIQIFEDEWKFKKDIVISKLKSIFKIETEKIGARNCSIRAVIPEEKNNFLNKNHIQGEDRTSHNIGLYYNKELVAIMTFCKPRVFMGHKKIEEGVFELSRYATSKNVVGGASKLLKYFINTYSPKKIISYADRRWSSNIEKTMYEKLGFIKTKVNSPNYWYLKHYKIRSHRYAFTKQRIINELGGDANKTEIANMIELGYDRIWDCGTIKYELYTD